MNNLKIIVFILILIAIVLEIIVSSGTEKNSSTKISISVSTFALYDISKHIAEESIEVINILPFGVDPHSFEPTPKLVAKIEKSALVFYSGAGLEPWIDGFSFQQRPIDLSKYVKLNVMDGIEHHEHQHENENNIDPHYWLDFENMKIITALVTDKLIKLLPENKSIYLRNKETYTKGLNNLENAYQKELSSCKLKRIILNHNSIAYLSSKYDFEVDSLSGFSSQKQPSPKDISRILKDIQENNISTIFFESFTNNNIIESISKDTGVNVELFQSLGNITADEALRNATYEDIMYKNLKKLSKALSCN